MAGSVIAAIGRAKFEDGSRITSKLRSEMTFRVLTLYPRSIWLEI